LTEDDDWVIEGEMKWRSVVTPIVATTEAPFLVLLSLEVKFSGSLEFTAFNFCPVPFHAVLSRNFSTPEHLQDGLINFFASLQVLSSVHQKWSFSALD